MRRDFNPVDQTLMTVGARSLVAVLLAVLLAVLPEQAAAAPFVEAVDPPVLQRGRTCRVTLRGTGLEQAVNLWTSSPGSPFAATPVEVGSDSDSESKAVLDVTVAEDAPIGLFGLRLATRSGLSNVHLILIDDLPVTRAADLKRDSDGVRALPLPACVAAECRAEAVDEFSIDVQSGERVSFEIVGSRFGKDYDPLITIRDADRRIVAQCDNQPGLFFDCRFGHEFAQAGRYVIEVRDSRFDGNPFWNYVLRAGHFSPATVAVPSAVTADFSGALELPEAGGARAGLLRGLNPEFPTSFAELKTESDDVAIWLPLTVSPLENRFEAEPNNVPEQATAAAVPGNLNGVLNASGDRDWFALDLKKDQTINVVGVSSDAGSAADLELVLLDPTGREIRRVDDLAEPRFDKPFVREAQFEIRIGRDGVHHLLIQDVTGSGGPAFAYRVEVSEPVPRIELSASYSRLTIPQNSWQPLPVQVKRIGFDGPVELALIGAPSGVSLSPHVIPAGVNEIVCRVVADGSAPELLTTLRLRGDWKSEDGTQSATAPVEVHPMIDRQPYNKDRQLYSLRDNQLRLPPSVTQCLALMVTPPAPFEFQLPLAELVLTKYQTAAFPLETPRQAGFTAPISFSATGGQIGDPDEERDQVYVLIPDAAGDQQQSEGIFHNRINTRYERKRCDVSATARFDSREVTLIRTFDLDVRSAFKPTFDPETVSLEPGSTASVRILANRTATFRGDVRLTLQRPEPFVTLPERIVIPEGADFATIELGVAADLTPRRLNLRFESVGDVGKFEESLNEPGLSIEVKKPDAAK